MPRLKRFRTKILNDLEKNILKYKDYYLNMDSHANWLTEHFEKINNNNYAVETAFEYEDFDLMVGGPDTDAQNAKTIYSNLKNLTPTQAVNSELWAYMTHIKFATYMGTRWNVKNNSEEKKLETVIRQRYFANRNDSKGVCRNGIARLWWAGYWGYDESRQDPFELVDIIFSQQEIYEHVSERSFNRNKNILLASLEAIKENDYKTREVRA